MKRRLPLIALLLTFNLTIGNMLMAQKNQQFTTKMIDGEEIVVSYNPENGDGGTRNLYPPIWDDPNGGGSTMGIIVKFESNPRVNDVPLEAGDFIGGFYTDDFGNLKCGGASPWPGNLGVVISLTGNNPDTPEKDGFSYQEQIYFKFFSWERMKEYDVDVIEFSPTSPTTDKWISLGLSEVIDMQALVDFDFYIEASANPICSGNPLTLTANEFVGSNGNYTYDWSSDPPGFNYNIPDPPTVIPSETTTYHLTVSDGNQVSDHFLTVIVNEEPTVALNEDASICRDQTFAVSAQATDYSSILWTTNGDGYFLNSNALQTTYYPGNGDKNNGGVLLTFTADPIAPCTMPASDVINLTINQYPSVDAGDDIPGCEDEPGVPITAVGIDYQSVLWTTNGDGTFENPEEITTTYYPGPQDFNTGDVDLTVCVQSIAPCTGNDCDQVTVILYPGPTCNAAPQLTKCENLPIQLSGIAFNNDGLQWTTQGDGTFDNPNIINAKYYAGENDKLTGQTTVTLNAFPVAPCTMTATKDVTLIFYPLPRLASFGENTDYLCPNDDYLQLDAGLEHFTSFTWSTNGDGNFTGATTLTPKYYPGTQDYQNQAFELELTASPVSPCTLSQTFTLNTEIYSDPEADIISQSGTTTCGAVNLSAQTVDVENYNWMTSGDGTFSNANTLNPVYNPGPTDLSSPASVTITLEGYSPCQGIQPAQDQVQLFFQDNVAVSAGADANICETDSYTPGQATATDFESLEWTTSGDGTFNNASVLNPVYSPGPGDIANGQVFLTLTGYSILPCTLVDDDMMLLSISEAPEVNAGLNATICDTESHQVENASALHYASVLWETSGDGSFSNAGNIEPVYYPGPGDIAAGVVSLTLNVNGIEPCDFGISDSQVLTIQQSPVASAGQDATICDNDSYFIGDATADNFASLLWETSGDGSFSNPTNVTSEYFPGPLDLSNGNVVLSLHSMAIAPCTLEDTDSKVLTIQQSPEADAGDDATICDISNHQVENSSAGQYSSLSWETSGDGTFNDNGLVSPIYYPGAGDLSSGNVTLTLNAFGINPCNFMVSDMHELTIQPSPEASAGVDAIICDNESYFIDDATADIYTSLVWETSGDGTFSNANTVNTEYFPGSADINNGTAVLTLIVDGIDPCTFQATDSKILSIQQSPVASAGPDGEICENEDYLLNAASAENFSSVNWETSGDGTFSNPNSIDPTYYPGFFDITFGGATLTLNAVGSGPCDFIASDSRVLVIQPQPEIDAGSDAAICNTAQFLISEASEQNTSYVLWETSGDGTFSDPATVMPVYTPGPADISSGTAILTISAMGLAPCDFIISDELELNIQQSPAANAGPDISVCENSAHMISQAFAENYKAVLWITSGDGTFNNKNMVNPTYFPGTDDELSGTVTLSLLATGLTPCYYPSIDEVNIYFQPLPEVDAGSDITSCGEVSLSGSATNASSTLWSTSGDGTFSDPGSASTVYYPGPGDIVNLGTTIQLTAFAVNPCVTQVSDNLQLNLNLPTIVDDQVNDMEVIAGELLQLEFVVANPEEGEFHWYKDDVLLPAYTTGTLLILGASTDDYGTYRCTFTNECGEVSSNEAFIQILEPFTQIINLETGWQGISTIAQPETADVALLFAPVEDQMVILSDNTGFYWPAQSINTLGQWSAESGYRLKMSGEATLTIEGYVKYPRNQVAIMPGWTYLPVNSSCPVDVQALFASHPEIKIIKDMAGTEVYWPGFGINNLETLQPGKAYQIYNQGGTLYIDIPECD